MIHWTDPLIFIFPLLSNVLLCFFFIIIVSLHSFVMHSIRHFTLCSDITFHERKAQTSMIVQLIFMLCIICPLASASVHNLLMEHFLASDRHISDPGNSYWHLTCQTGRCHTQLNTWWQLWQITKQALCRHGCTVMGYLSACFFTLQLTGTNVCL